MSEQERVGDIEVGLTSDPGEVVVTASVLDKDAVNEIGADGGGDSADERLVAQEHIVAAAGSADASTVKGAAHELVQVATIFNAVAK